MLDEIRMAEFSSSLGTRLGSSRVTPHRWNHFILAPFRHNPATQLQDKIVHDSQVVSTNIIIYYSILYIYIFDLYNEQGYNEQGYNEQRSNLAPNCFLKVVLAAHLTLTVGTMLSRWKAQNHRSQVWGIRCSPTLDATHKSD